VVKRRPPPYADDQVKEEILRYLHEKRTNPRGIDSAKVGIMDLRRALKQKGIEQKEVIRNLLYLIEAKWVREEVEENQIWTGKRTFIQKSKTFIITNQGMELFDGKSKFHRPNGLAGINIQNVTGVVNLGDNNIIRNEAVNLYRTLEELDNRIRLADQLNDEEKLNYRAEIKTIESQLSKPSPDRNILSRSWSVLKGLATIGSLANFVEKVRPAIEQIITNPPPNRRVKLPLSLSRAKALKMLEEQEELLDRMEQEKGDVVAGPLTRLLIQGKIEMLRWFLTIETAVENHALSLDTRIIQMLQKQRDLLNQSIDDRNPNSINKVEIQGRIEILEWLLMN